MTSKYYPESLKPLRVWCLWRIETDSKGRPTKVPYSALYDGRASSSNPNTWTTFDEASRRLNERPDYYNGLSLAISKEERLIFIDVDHCIDEDGLLSETASDIFGAFHDQFAEISQSGSGLHIIARGTIPKSFKNSSNGVEMYDHARFVALTGNALSAHEPHEEQDALDYVFRVYRTPERIIKPLKSKTRALNHDDSWIIDKASKRGLFADLYAGNWHLYYGSQSEADLALCLILAFWTDCDPDQMDRIFRSSGLYREKWEREDYRERTIMIATSQCGETLSDYQARRCEEDERNFIDLWSR